MQTLIELFERYGLNHELAWLSAFTIALSVLLLVSYLVFKLVDILVNRVVQGFVRRSSNKWDDLIFDMKVIPRAAHLAPVLAINVLTPALFAGVPAVTQTIDKLVVIYLIVVFILIIEAVINFVYAIYQRQPVATTLPLTGVVQAVKLVLFLVGAILVIAQIIGQSPLVLVSGFGAMTAVLLLIFREPILGLVAGVQLTANNMVKKGDWIEMPNFDADGDVIDITLTTVKVQNWDKTVTSIPAYALIQNAFRNWRGMQEAGGRRIRRPIFIDINTISFLDDAVLERFSEYRFLEDYLQSKRHELAEHNRSLGETCNIKVDGRALTNIGTFRAYCTAYLKKHPHLNQNLTMMVRQLEPTPHGLPLEIYCFTSDTRWPVYEGIQADIFDHLFAVLPEFNLRAYQQPTSVWDYLPRDVMAKPQE